MKRFHRLSLRYISSNRSVDIVSASSTRVMSMHALSILGLCFVAVGAAPSVVENGDLRDSCQELHPSLRIECGWAGIKKSKCEARGCCFDDRFPKSLWCFKKDENTEDMDLSDSEIQRSVLRTCSVTPWRRKDCGWPGITSEECENRRCCYSEVYKRSFWCFQPETMFAQPVVEKILRCTSECLSMSWRKTVSLGVDCGTRTSCWQDRKGVSAATCMSSCKTNSNVQDFIKNVSFCLELTNEIRGRTSVECDFDMSCWEKKHGVNAEECFKKYSEYLTGIETNEQGLGNVESDLIPQIQMPRTPTTEVLEPDWILALEPFARDPNTLLTEIDVEKSVKYPVLDLTEQDDEGPL